MPPSHRNKLLRLLAILVVPFLALIAAKAQSVAPYFPVTQFASNLPSYPFSGVSADFNADGSPDFAQLVYGANSVSISVTLSGPSGYTSVTSESITGCTFGSLFAADFNKDGKIDLASTCTQGYVVVLAGNGDGTFQTPLFVSTGYPVSSATAVDLNGDGYPDLVAAGSAQLFIMLNKGSTGSPAFSAATSMSYGLRTYIPGPLASGDFNGDGKQDVVLGSSSAAGSTISEVVLYGNGDGTLQTAQQITTETNNDFVAGDLNGDGISDLVFVSSQNEQPSTAQVFLGGASGFTSKPSFELPDYAGSGSPVLVSDSA